jgi:L-lactate dehydrogenase complex protein LldG
MSTRDVILAAVRKNRPQPVIALPELPKISHSGEPALSCFRRQLEEMGGRSFEVADAAAARAKVAELFPAARVVCSAVDEVPGNRSVRNVNDPHKLNDVDVGVVRSRLGVAEAGAVWLTEADLVVNALGVLSQHLVVLLDPSSIVETMHDAYAQIDLTGSTYGVFMAGPSATGDIEGVIIHGAQGARSMTILILAAPRPSALTTV